MCVFLYSEKVDFEFYSYTILPFVGVDLGFVRNRQELLHDREHKRFDRLRDVRSA